MRQPFFAVLCTFASLRENAIHRRFHRQGAKKQRIAKGGTDQSRAVLRFI